jgi:hypothetical protein
MITGQCDGATARRDCPKGRARPMSVARPDVVVMDDESFPSPAGTSPEADSNDGLEIPSPNAAHAVIDTELTRRVWVAVMRPFVDKCSHLALSG